MNWRCISFFTALLLWAGVVQAAGEPAAKLVFASGKPVIVDAKGAQKPAQRGDDLLSGEMLDSKDGLVQLRFRDGASMSLQPATQFRVDDYRFREVDGKASAEDKGFFTLVKGGLRTATGLVGKEKKEQYQVKTTVAVIGIRGTDYGAKLDDNGLELSTFSGTVAVCNNTGCVLVGAGQNVLVPGLNAPPQLGIKSFGSGGQSQALPGVPSASVTNPNLPSQPGGQSPHSPNHGMTSPNYNR